MISYSDFLEKYSITADMLSASGFGWADLVEMYEDFSSKRDAYGDILVRFQQQYLDSLLVSEANARPVVHSLHSRVKDPKHLMAKAVRRRNENYKKYAAMDASNYEKRQYLDADPKVMKARRSGADPELCGQAAEAQPRSSSSRRGCLVLEQVPCS